MFVTSREACCRSRSAAPRFYCCHASSEAGRERVPRRRPSYHGLQFRAQGKHARTPRRFWRQVTYPRAPNLLYHCITSSTSGAFLEASWNGMRRGARGSVSQDRHSGGVGAPPGSITSSCQELADIREHPFGALIKSAARRCSENAACGAPRGARRGPVEDRGHHRFASFGAPLPFGGDIFEPSPGACASRRGGRTP